MLVDGQWFRANVIETLGSVSDRDVGHALGDILIEILGVQTKRCRACEEVK